MKTNNFIFLILSLVTISCTPAKKGNMTQIAGTLKNDSMYVVDLDIQEEKENFLYSSIFNKVETIILETRKDALVTEYFKFLPFEDYLYILNVTNPRECLLFDRKGKFIRKIGGLGGGPGEYIYPKHFTIDPDNKILYLLCGRSINKYSLDGTFIGAMNIYESAGYIHFYKGKLYLAGDEKYLLIEIDPETGKSTSRFLDMDQYCKGVQMNIGFSGPFVFKSEESPKFVCAFMDTIVMLQPNGIAPFLVLRSKHLISDADRKYIKETPQEELFLNRGLEKMNKIYHVDSYFETKNKIIFSYKYEEKANSIIFDLSNKTYKKQKVLNDLVFNQGNMRNILYADTSGVYESYQYGFYFTYIYDWIQQGFLALDLDKREELMQLPEDTNPVIFFHSYN